DFWDGVVDFFTSPESIVFAIELIGTQAFTCAVSTGTACAIAIGFSALAVASAGVGNALTEHTEYVQLPPSAPQQVVQASGRLSPVVPPFKPPFPISAPGLLLFPNPNYPGVVVNSQGVVIGSFSDISVSVNGTVVVTLAPSLGLEDNNPGSLLIFPIVDVING